MDISRKERDDLRRQREIMAAALSIFAAQGFHGTTMAQISEGAQYPLGTIYKYFSSKKQIYHELVMERVHKLGDILYEISIKPDLSPTEKLKQFLFAQSTFYRTNNEFIRIYISERSTIDSVLLPKLNEKVNRMNDKMVSLFQKTFEQGQKGEFKSYPPREMALLFTDIAHSVSWSSLFETDDEESHQKRLELIFDIFLNGVAGNNPPQEN